MKKKSGNISIRELFRQKLGKTRVIPGADVKSQLMRRVARKEFMQFNPDRLNIYYLGGIFIAGIASALLFISPSGHTDQTMSSVKPENPHKIDTVDYLSIPAHQSIKEASYGSDVIYNKSLTDSINSESRDKSSVTVNDSGREKKTNEAYPAAISNSLSKNRLSIGRPTDKLSLQSGYNDNEFLIETSASVGCAPLKVWFHNKSNTSDSCRWTFGDGGYSDERDPEWIFDIEGVYNVILQIFSHDGKHLEATKTVTVHPRPQAHFEIIPEKAILPDDEISFLNFSRDAVQYKWDFGDGFTSELFEPRHKYLLFSSYNISLVVISNWGCSDTLTVLNAFSGSVYFIDFPNAFIPDEQGQSGGYFSSKSDEAAQVFHPSYSGVTDYHLKIFSKLGIQIFESNDINIGWDGYNKGQLCDPGVYIWKVRGKFRNGEPFIKMGDVMLLKN